MSNITLQMRIDTARRNADYEARQGLQYGEDRRLGVKYWNATAAAFLSAMRANDLAEAAAHEARGKRLELMACGAIPLEPI